MTADFAFIAHAAQSHADVLAACCFGNGFAQRGFTHPRRTDQTQNRTFKLVHTFLDGKVFQNPFFDFFQTVVVGVQHQIGFGNVFADTGFFLPRQLKQSIDVVAYHGGFRRHRRHHFELCQFGQAFLFGFFGHARFFDFRFQRIQFAAFVFFAQFFLNRFHLLVQIILALGFFHLAFDTAADAFFDLHDVQFGFQLGKQKLHTADNAEGFQNLLALLQFQLQMRCNRVHQTAVIIDAVDGIDDFGRDFFI